MSKNRRKLRSFKEALQVFLDSNSLEIFDKIHSNESEERYKVIGLLSSFFKTCNHLSYFYTERTERGDEILRIISARKEANKKEEKEAYEKQT